MTEIKVRLFGAFRNLKTDPEILVSVPKAPITLADFRTYLRLKLHSAEGFDAVGLLEKSVIANDTTVLSDSDFVHLQDNLALLPPVSGG